MVVVVVVVFREMPANRGCGQMVGGGGSQAYKIIVRMGACLRRRLAVSLCRWSYSGRGFTQVMYMQSTDSGRHEREGLSLYRCVAQGCSDDPALSNTALTQAR